MLIRVKVFLVFFICLFFTNVKAQEFRNERNTIVIDSSLNTSLSPADYLLLKVENIHNTLDNINNISQNRFNTTDIESDLPDIEEQISMITFNTSKYEHVLNVKNLQMSQRLLKDIQQQLKEWRTSLFSFNAELIKMKSQMANFAKDSLLKAIAKDTLYKELYTTELNNIKGKWKEANHFTDSNITRISKLQEKISKDYFEAIELRHRVRAQLSEIRSRSWKQEYPALFSSLVRTTSKETIQSLLKRSYAGKRKMLNFYIASNVSLIFIILAASVLFFYWVFLNFKKVLKDKDRKMQLQELNFKYINPFPLSAAFIFFINLAPFIDFTPPSVYVELVQFLLIVVLTLVFYKNWEKNLLTYWIYIIALYLLFTVTNSIFNASFLIRIWLLLLNSASVYFGMIFLKRMIKALGLPPFVKIVSVIFILLNILAVLANIFGRLTLTKTFSMAGIYGLIEVIGLSVFIQILTESLYLQLHSSRNTAHIVGRYNYSKLLTKLNKVFSFLMVTLWLVIFTTNMGIYTMLYRVTVFVLNEPRTFGSTTFNLRNLIFFFAILYVSNFLQKYIGYFFGETDDEVIPDRRGSRLVVLRLVLLLIGFFLAVTASGLPIDKITIVLGALGVGIGLGLQNIVNNFVSGIILIFESPFQIGDSIQLNDKKGIVRDIGIRSSKIMTAEGSEIIMPNGDLLSGQVINYSTNNNSLRSELLFKIDPASVEKARKGILEIIEGYEEVSKKVSPEVFINNISGVNIELKAIFWVVNIRKEQAVKTHILMEVYKKFSTEDVKLV